MYYYQQSQRNLKCSLSNGRSDVYLYLYKSYFAGIINMALKHLADLSLLKYKANVYTNGKHFLEYRDIVYSILFYCLQTRNLYGPFFHKKKIEDKSNGPKCLRWVGDSSLIDWSHISSQSLYGPIVGTIDVKKLLIGFILFFHYFRKKQ